MDARAEQLVLDYLRLLGDAAQEKLRPEDRQKFLARSRAAIARQVGETRAEQPGEVQRLLRRFGDPQKLAAAERHRLDANPPARPKPVGRLKRNGRHATLADSATPATSAAPAASAAPATSAAPAVSAGLAVPGTPALSVAPVGIEGLATPVTFVTSASPASSTGPTDSAGPGPSYQQRSAAAARGRLPSAAPVLHRPMTARWRPGADLTEEPRQTPPVLRSLARWPVTRSLWPPVSRPTTPTTLDGREPDSGDRRDPSDAGAGPDTPSPARPDTPSPAGPATARDWLDGLFTLVRRHPLECAAVGILGVGGLIDPFPLWVLGALVVLLSRLWDTRDKLAAVAVPMAVALLGAITLAGLNARSLSLYAHGVHTDGWDIIRIGAVLGAAYLAWRVHQGPRPRRGPPWQHFPRN